MFHLFAAAPPPAGSFDWLAATPPAVIAAVIAAIVSLIVTAINPLAARNLERLKAELAQDNARDSVRLQYETEARKKLEPLLFELAEAAEGAYFRVASLVRSQKTNKLGMAQNSWLAAGAGGSLSYYLVSTIYLLFLPLVTYRLIRRSATAMSLTLDADIRTKYLLLKASAVCFTDDYEIAAFAPALTYEPIRPDWASARLAQPAVVWRQGLVLGHLEQMLDAMIVTDGTERRPMTYGEFHKALAMGLPDFMDAAGPALDIFEGFSFPERPVLARILLAQATLMHLLSKKYGAMPERAEIESAIDAFAASQAARETLLWTGADAGVWEAVRPYLKHKVNWAYPA